MYVNRYKLFIEAEQLTNKERDNQANICTARKTGRHEKEKVCNRTQR